MAYPVKRTEQVAKHEATEATPASIAEAHLALILAVMESEYEANGVDGLGKSAWTTTLVEHAKSHGMRVTKEQLLESIKARQDNGVKGNFFTDLREAVTQLRTGITLDKNIRAIDGYVV